MSRPAALFALSMMVIAQPVCAECLFDVPAVDDSALAAARGGFAPYSLSQERLVHMEDNAAGEQFRLISSVGGIAIDDWWATTGAALIDNAALHIDRGRTF